MVSKEFQLLAGSLYAVRLFPVKQFYLAKLFVRNAHDSHLSIIREERFNSFYMYRCILAAGAMADINGKLEHRESIALQILPKIGIGFLVFLRFRRQIKKNQHPHDPVFTETIHQNSE